MRQHTQQATEPASISLVLALILAGCASTKEAVLPQDGPSMKAIYDAHFEEMVAHNPQVIRGALGSRPAGPDRVSGDPPLTGYVRGAYHELETTFPRLPNPTLVMYVFPHLATDERVPVPGYVTTFPMYERVEYALPGEISPVRSHDRPLDGIEADHD